MRGKAFLMKKVYHGDAPRDSEKVTKVTRERDMAVSLFVEIGSFFNILYKISKYGIMRKEKLFDIAPLRDAGNNWQ